MKRAFMEICSLNCVFFSLSRALCNEFIYQVIRELQSLVQIVGSSPHPQGNLMLSINKHSFKGSFFLFCASRARQSLLLIKQTKTKFEQFEILFNNSHLNGGEKSFFLLFSVSIRKQGISRHKWA